MMYFHLCKLATILKMATPTPSLKCLSLVDLVSGPLYLYKNYKISSLLLEITFTGHLVTHLLFTLFQLTLDYHIFVLLVRKYNPRR